MIEIGYHKISLIEYPLPNGKKLVKIDFAKGVIVMEKVLVACGNDCSACPRYIAPPYEKTDE